MQVESLYFVVLLAVIYGRVVKKIALILFVNFVILTLLAQMDLEVASTLTLKIWL